MRHRRFSSIALLLAGAAAALSAPACTEEAPKPAAEAAAQGTGMALTVDIAGGTDVAGYRFTVNRVSCAGEAYTPYSTTRDLDLEDVLIGGHVFSDLFIVLDAGCYDVIAQPITAQGTPSAECSLASADNVQIVDGQTTEITLVSQCGEVPPVGAIDIIGVINHPPVLRNLTFDPSKFVCGTQQQIICVDFQDADHDPVDIVWQQISGAPLLSGPTVTSTTFDANTGWTTQCVSVQHSVIGRVDLRVTAYDLMADPSGGGLVRYEDYLAQQSIPVISHDDLELMSYSEEECVNVEVCNGQDDDGDGLVDEGIQPISCYSGPAGTQGVGICHGGTRTCANGQWGVCAGQVLPAATENCSTPADDNCNGTANDGCGGGGGGGGGGGSGDPEVCNGQDDDLDGQIDEGIGPQACYTGPAGTQGVGACQSGTQTCANGQWGACAGQVLPAAQEDCSTPADDNCNGVANGASEGCPSQEVCDGVDNNGNGVIDEGICCATTCVPMPEVCDGFIDNDCDGLLDALDPDLVITAEIPGNGIDDNCNYLVDEYPGCTVQMELHDGIDNNCNGLVDEGFGCNSASPESCNGVDDNCDGHADEGLCCSWASASNADDCDGDAATSCWQVPSVTGDPALLFPWACNTQAYHIGSSSSWPAARYNLPSVTGISSGKWYWEVSIPSSPGYDSHGVCVGVGTLLTPTTGDAYLTNLGDGWCYDVTQGLVFPGSQPAGVTPDNGSPAGSVVSVLLDLDCGEIRFRVNGQTDDIGPFPLATGFNFYPMAWLAGNGYYNRAISNFGPHFQHAVPIGYQALHP